MITLDKAIINTDVVVSSITGEQALKRRLMDLGILPGVKIFVRKIAPLGDPIEITVKNTDLTLRKHDAKNVSVEPISQS
ncbi:MAG: ferrous iron transport protein A [Candidatus Izemoplasmatales bacterium]